jgi:hypothetical protein
MYLTKELIKDTQTESIFSINEIIDLRDKFVKSFCTSKGWDKTNLSIEQVTEIRQTNGWKNPGMLNS